jgi:serine/threonine-protein kinase
MSDDERTELMRATPARTPAASMLAPPSRIVPAEPFEEDDEATRKKRVWGFIGVGALCLAVLAGAIWVTINITSRSATVAELPVPNVVGMKQADAVARLREVGFEADSNPAYVEVSDDQVGLVQQQNPSSPTVRPTTDKVKLTIGVAAALVKVPNLSKLSQADADAILRSFKLVPVFVTAPSAATEEGQVVSQDKAFNTDVPPNTTVTVTIGTGVKKIAVPAKETMVGQQYDGVQAALKASGFEVFQQVQKSSKPLNEILDVTGVQPGGQVQEGTIVTLVTSDNSQFTVPNILQSSEKSANTALAAAGWTAGNTVQVTQVEVGNPGQYNVIIKQDPAANSDYDKNGVIKVQIGVPKQVNVPTVTGMSEGDARSALANAGLTGSVVTATKAADSPDQVGKVVFQTPQANSTVKANTKVTITVAVAGTPGAPPTP